MAPLLTFEEGNYKGIKVKFKNLLVIGSGDTVNLKLSEENISPSHLAIIKGSDGFYLTSLSENSSIYLNSQIVQSSRINNNDIVTLAPNCSFRFILEDEEVNEFPDTQVAHKNSNKKKFKLTRKSEINQIEIPTTQDNTPFFKKVIIVSSWIILFICLLAVSFISGIHVTNAVLQVK